MSEERASNSAVVEAACDAITELSQQTCESLRQFKELTAALGRSVGKVCITSDSAVLPKIRLLRREHECLAAQLADLEFQLKHIRNSSGLFSKEEIGLGAPVDMPDYPSKRLHKAFSEQGPAITKRVSASSRMSQYLSSRPKKTIKKVRFSSNSK